MSAGKAVSGILATVNIASTVFDTWEFLEGGGEINAVDVGLMALASVAGVKVFKVLGRKFMKKYGCDKGNKKGICQIFQSDAKRMNVLRATLGLAAGQKNVAFADYITTSGVGTINAVSGRTLKGTAGISVPVVTGFDGHTRKYDAEVKIYSTLYSKFNSSTVGLVRVVSELNFCRSCARGGKVFAGRHPRIVYLSSSVSSSSSRRK